jgi:nucleotide-binding universal stress UspA family protein
MELIVAFDASEESKNALHSAIEMAQRLEGTVTVLHAFEQSVRPTDSGTPGQLIEDFDSAVERSNRIMTSARAIADSLEFDIDTEIVQGNPTDRVLEYTEQHDQSMIYVGHREVAGTKPGVGSVAQRLIRDSPVPVTVVN